MEGGERVWAEGRSRRIGKEKGHDRKLAHKAIINADKQYIRSVGRRAIRDYEITISHHPDTVGGGPFIKQRVKIRLLFRWSCRKLFLGNGMAV